jgi:double-stranded uracil-DNA glycosylase
MPILPDVLRPGLRLVICGSAVGPASYRERAYYAHPQNRFWTTLHEVGLTPRRFAPHESASLLAFGIGLTDLAKEEWGVDAALSRAAYDADALRARIAAAAPAILAFNGMGPARAFHGGRRLGYGRQPDGLGATAVHVLPSTSAAARRHWDIGPWRALAGAVSHHPIRETPR